jgi:membrane fusion protein, heavy metal efflux system
MNTQHSLLRRVGFILLPWSLLGCHTHKEQEHAAPAAATDAETVRIEAGNPQEAVQFKVTQVSLQSALPLPTVTGRVTTLLGLTSPTFAPLSGRIATVSVRLGQKVQKGDRLVEVRAAELSTLRRDVETARLAAKTREALVQRLDRQKRTRRSTFRRNCRR